MTLGWRDKEFRIRNMVRRIAAVHCPVACSGGVAVMAGAAPYRIVAGTVDGSPAGAGAVVAGAGARAASSAR